MTALDDAGQALQPQPGPPPPPDEAVADAFARLEAQARAEITRSIRVPRWDPPIGIKVRPLTEDEYVDSLRTRDGAQTAGKRLLHAADLLARACIGIFLQVGKDRRVALNPEDPDGEWPTFGAGLRPFLGRDCGDEAASWVIGLFRTEPDVIAAADELVAWSGYGNKQVKERLAGE